MILRRSDEAVFLRIVNVLFIHHHFRSPLPPLWFVLHLFQHNCEFGDTWILHAGLVSLSRLIV